MSNEIRFVVPGQPVGKGRARSAVRRLGTRAVVHHYTPDKTRDYEGRVGLHGALEMGRLGLRPLTGALSVVLDIRLEIPKSWSEAKRAEALAGRLYPTGKPDVDNIIKAVYDGLNGVCWVDDAQICNGVQYKRYAETPGVLVGIKELG